MRYPREHKGQVRGKLLADSASHAKKHGFGSSGVDALAAAAGLTIGSLYKHFANKNQLFAALISAELQRTVALFAALEPDDAEGQHKALAGYLSMAHVRSPEHGCALPSITPEVARSTDEVRTAFETGIVELKNTLARLTGSEQSAWTLIAQNVGAVMMARAMRNEDCQRELLRAVRAAGSAMLGSESA